MKKILSILFLIPLITFSQKNVAEQNALKWFKGVYVENNFKDPYSFKLLKISSIPQTTYETMRGDDVYPLLEDIGIEKNDEKEFGIILSFLISDGGIFFKIDILLLTESLILVAPVILTSSSEYLKS